MKKRRLLLLSYAFPPATAPEAMLSAKRVGNLPGWEAEVIAAAPFHPGMGNDPEMAAYAQARFARIHRLVPRVRLPWHRLGLLGQLPDGLRLLNGETVRLAQALHAAQPFDAVLSWSTYHSVHLAALQLKRRLGLPWLAHMSDPWADNPFAGYRGLSAKLNLRMERSVIEAADRVLLTSPETTELVMGKYPQAWREKVVEIPHGYDASLYSGAEPAPRAGRPLVARYLGNFYGVRLPEPLFNALHAALATYPGLKNELVVEIVGRLDNGMAKTAAAERLPVGLVRVVAPVGYRRSLELMETADLLLIVDAPASISVFLPSKLVDYIGAGRPILSFTPEGAACRVTKEAGCWSAIPEDASACAEALIKAVRHIREGNTGSRRLTRYSVESTAAQLASVLDDVVGQRPPRA